MCSYLVWVKLVVYSYILFQIQANSVVKGNKFESGKLQIFTYKFCVCGGGYLCMYICIKEKHVLRRYTGFYLSIYSCLEAMVSLCK